MKKIIGIGGAVIKTGTGEELKKRIDDIEMIIFNGGAMFHDFQLALERDKIYPLTSIPIKELNNSLKRIEYTSKYFWKYLRGRDPPKNSLTEICKRNNIPTLLFTALGCDYWQMFDNEWELIGKRCRKDFEILRNRMDKPFHYINMGSAVIHPEVFAKAIQGIKHEFRADVVDFLDMYRPRTRVSIYGNYYQMDFKEYMEKEW